MFIGGLPINITQEESRGFGFVTFNNPKIIDQLIDTQPHTIEGKQVEFKRAVPKDLSNANQLVHANNQIGQIGKPNSSAADLAKKNLVGKGASKNQKNGFEDQQQFNNFLGGQMSQSYQEQNSQFQQNINNESQQQYSQSPNQNINQYQGVYSNEKFSQQLSEGSNDQEAQYKKIFVGGLPHNLEVEEFRAYFEQYGELEDCVILQDKRTKKPRGFGFITYIDIDCADKVMEIKDQHQIQGKWVECKRAVSISDMKDGSSSNEIQSENNSHPPEKKITQAVVVPQNNVKQQKFPKQSIPSAQQNQQIQPKQQLQQNQQQRSQNQNPNFNGQFQNANQANNFGSNQFQQHQQQTPGGPQPWQQQQMNNGGAPWQQQFGPGGPPQWQQYQQYLQYLQFMQQQNPNGFNPNNFNPNQQFPQNGFNNDGNAPNSNFNNNRQFNQQQNNNGDFQQNQQNQWQQPGNNFNNQPSNQMWGTTQNTIQQQWQQQAPNSNNNSWNTSQNNPNLQTNVPSNIANIAKIGENLNTSGGHPGATRMKNNSGGHNSQGSIDDQSRDQIVDQQLSAESSAQGSQPFFPKQRQTTPTQVQQNPQFQQQQNGQNQKNQFQNNGQMFQGNNGPNGNNQQFNQQNPYSQTTQGQYMNNNNNGGNWQNNQNGQQNKFNQYQQNQQPNSQESLNNNGQPYQQNNNFNPGQQMNSNNYGSHSQFDTMNRHQDDPSNMMNRQYSQNYNDSSQQQFNQQNNQYRNSMGNNQQMNKQNEEMKQFENHQYGNNGMQSQNNSMNQWGNNGQQQQQQYQDGNLSKSNVNNYQVDNEFSHLQLQNQQNAYSDDEQNFEQNIGSNDDNDPQFQPQNDNIIEEEDGIPEKQDRLIEQIEETPDWQQYQIEEQKNANLASQQQESENAAKVGDISQISGHSADSGHQVAQHSAEYVKPKEGGAKLDSNIAKLNNSSIANASEDKNLALKGNVAKPQQKDLDQSFGPKKFGATKNERMHANSNRNDRTYKPF